MIEDDLRTEVLADAGISALIGTRYYPGVLPQKPTYPAVVAQVVSNVDEPTLDGVANIVRARVQINAWAETYASARSVVDSVRALLDGTTGTWSGTKVGSVRVENEIDTYGEETSIYGRQIDLMILYHR